MRLFAIALLLLTGCGPQPGASCATTCPAGLACVFFNQSATGECVKPCTTDVDCPSHLCGSGSSCQFCKDRVGACVP